MYERMKIITLRSIENFGNLIWTTNPQEHLSAKIEDLVQCGWFLSRKRTQLLKKSAFGNLIEYTLRNDNLKKDCMFLSNTVTACKQCRKNFIL